MPLNTKHDSCRRERLTLKPYDFNILTLLLPRITVPEIPIATQFNRLHLPPFPAGITSWASSLQNPRFAPVDMWTIGFQPNGGASPVLLRKDGEMLAFAHIPTGAHNHPDDFKIDGREREALSGLRPPIVFPAFGQLTAGAVPLAKRLVRYFSRTKNLPVPPQAALFAGPPPGRRSGLQGRDEERAFGPNKERSFKSTPAPIF